LREEFGTTIVVTTHYLDEADALADRVVVVDHGLVIADGTAERLKSELVGDSVTLTAGNAADAHRVARLTGRMPDVRLVEVAGVTVTARAAGATALLPELLRKLDRRGVHVAAADVTRATLDDVFLTLTGRSLRESAVADTPSESDPIIEEQVA
jgi:ABC-2 type transport system ATP-binding protein